MAHFLPPFAILGQGQKLENPLPRSTLRDKRERGKNLKPEPKLWDLLLLLLLSQTSKTQNPPQPLPPSPLFSSAGISNTQNPNNHTKTWKDTLGKKKSVRRGRPLPEIGEMKCSPANKKSLLSSLPLNFNHDFFIPSFIKPFLFPLRDHHQALPPQLLD